MFSRSALIIISTSLLLLSLTGCDNIVEALFGQTVTVNRNDSSPPDVRILIQDRFVSRPASGDLIVTTEPQTAIVATMVTFSVIGEDLQGVQFTEVDEISVTPYCAIVYESRNGRPPAPPTFSWATERMYRGGRVEVPLDSETATTRIPYIRTLSFRLHLNSDLCPAERPLLGNIKILLKGRAGNFGGQTTETGVATLYLNSLGSSSGRFPGGSSGSSEGERCSGEGDACTTSPAICSSRSDTWTVPGRIQCQGGEPICVAQEGRDYCSICGGECGACIGQSCSASSPCAPGSICASEQTLGGTVYRCRSITITESSSGRRPCTPIPGYCWTADEAGQAEIICSEAQ